MRLIIRHDASYWALLLIRGMRAYSEAMSSPLLAMLGFGAAVLPVCLTPGVSFALVTERALRSGMLAAGAVTAGTLAGLFTHALLAAAGLSAIVMRSAEAFTVIKLIGAVYLTGIGLWMLVKARLRSEDQVQDTTVVRMPWHRGGDFVQGYLGNVFNPKAAAVYLTLAPQFLDPRNPVAKQVVELWVAHAVVGGGWLLMWGVAVRGLHRRLDLYRHRRRLTAMTGVVMIGLGLRTATVR